MTKTHWNTDDVIGAIKGKLPNVTVDNTGPGGDVDTDNLVVRLPGGGNLLLCGFITDGDLGANRSDVDVEMVELSAGKDSRGGLHGVIDPEVGVAYGNIHAVLVGLGFSVVPCLKDYF